MLGIIGGNGVAATNKLNCLIENYFTQSGFDRDCQHPEIITWQATHVPSRSRYLEGLGESFIPGYVEIGRQLKALGCQKLCMCCNTAHYAIDQLEEEIGLPFINLIKEVVKLALNSSAQRIGLIVTSGCLIGKVYDRYFNNNENFLIYPDPEFQKMVTKGIYGVKNTNRFLSVNAPDRPKYLFTQVCNHLVEKGADLIILGGTDISVDFTPEDYNRCKCLDSLQILAQAICQNFEGGEI